MIEEFMNGGKDVRLSCGQEGVRRARRVCFASTAPPQAVAIS
jgi:hypothetical protein